MKRRQMNDECRAWLESYQELRSEADRQWRKHMRLRDQATQITARLSLVPGGGGGDKEKLLAALADAAEEALQKQQAALDRQQEIERFIDCIPTPVCRQILRLRYVDLCTWREVEKRLKKTGTYYEERQIFNLHGKALREARTIWEEQRRG